MPLPPHIPKARLINLMLRRHLSVDRYLFSASLLLPWRDGGVVGLIFAIIAKKKIGQYLPQYGELTGAAKVGKILGTIGLVFSIIFTVFWSIYLIAIIVALIGANAVVY